MAPPDLKSIIPSDRQEGFKVVPFRTAMTGLSSRFRGTFLLRRLQAVQRYGYTIPSYLETRHYVRRVLEFYGAYR